MGPIVDTVAWPTSPTCLAMSTETTPTASRPPPSRLHNATGPAAGATSRRPGRPRALPPLGPTSRCSTPPSPTGPRVRRSTRPPRSATCSPPTSTRPAPPLPDDLAAALSAALVGAPPGDVALVAPPAPGLDVDHTTLASTSDPADPPPGGGASWAELAATRRASVDYADPFAESMPLVGRLPWQRGDDDILPRRSSSSRRGRGGLSLRRK